MAVAYITDKKRRLGARINTIIQNSQEYVGFLQSQNPSGLKKEAKTKSLSRCITGSKEQLPVLEEGAKNNEGSKTNLKSTQKIWLLPSNSKENLNSTSKLQRDNSLNQSLTKDDSVNKSIYDVISKQESINSNITTSWSPQKPSLTKSKTIAGRSNSILKKRLKSFKDVNYTEKSETLEDEHDNSLNKSDSKVNIVTEIRTSQPAQVLDSRTAYIGHAVEIRANINERLQEKVFSKQKTDPDTCPEIENLRLVPKFLAEPKWRVAPYKFQLKKKAEENSPIKCRDDSKLIMNFYKKIARIDLNTSVLRPDESREELNRSRPDLNVSRVSLQGNILNGSKPDIHQSKADYYCPKIDSNNASAIKPVPAFEPDRYKIDVSERLLGSDANLPSFKAKANLQSLLLVGRKNSKEDNKPNRETGEQRKWYVSGLFPGFRPKTFIKKDVDTNELYRQNLKSEVERRLTRAFKDVNKTLNTSMEQAAGDRLNKTVNDDKEIIAREFRKYSRDQKRLIEFQS